MSYSKLNKNVKDLVNTKFDSPSELLQHLTCNFAITENEFSNFIYDLLSKENYEFGLKTTSVELLKFINE